ncbi:MAG: rRNA maturation RNase YbeY [bacterium]|nr:rRNA maturation RNase YbeY [bacterium]
MKSESRNLPAGKAGPKSETNSKDQKVLKLGDLNLRIVSNLDIGIFNFEAVVGGVLRSASKKVRCPKGAQVSVIFIGDAKMRKMNKTYRGKDKTTNVLAFPVAPHPSLSRWERMAEGQVRELGDIFISLPEAKREAKKYGWTMKYEIARLALHGFLHLLGYDHEKDGEAKVMEGIEGKILNSNIEIRNKFK